MFSFLPTADEPIPGVKDFIPIKAVENTAKISNVTKQPLVYVENKLQCLYYPYNLAKQLSVIFFKEKYTLGIESHMFKTHPPLGKDGQPLNNQNSQENIFTTSILSSKASFIALIIFTSFPDPLQFNTR